MDEWLQDQLVVYMALAAGTSRIVTGSLTLHTQTAIWVAEQLCGAHFEVEKIDGGQKKHWESGGYGQEGRIPGRHLIRCEGIGLRPSGS